MSAGPKPDFNVPSRLIAQSPSSVRDECRLLLYDSLGDRISHDVFKNVGNHLRPGDVLVLNQSQVWPARVSARKMTGGRVEILFLEKGEPGNGFWKVLLKPFLRPGTDLELPTGQVAQVWERLPEGECLLSCGGADPLSIMERYGSPPLPPYIKRRNGSSQKMPDADWYQTVYARCPGSVAAPTAGLHFTRPLLSRLEERGVRIVYLTLHIGWGTFRPIRCERLEDHRMLPESFELDEQAALAINRARQEGHRVMGVGTSVVRALESCLEPDGTLRARRGKTDLFIHLPYAVRSIDGFLTNFHLPHSTSLALLDAVIGPKMRRTVYEEAVRRDYRFYSYGDAMLVV